MKELKFGEYALMGSSKLKRIYLGYANSFHYAVGNGDEERFEACINYRTDTWEVAEPIEEPVYYYVWEKVNEDGYMFQTAPMTDEYADHYGYINDGYIRNDSTKREALKGDK